MHIVKLQSPIQWPVTRALSVSLLSEAENVKTISITVQASWQGAHRLERYYNYISVTLSFPSDELKNLCPLQGRHKNV